METNLKNKKRDFSGLPNEERILIEENYKSSDKVAKQYSGIHGTKIREGIPHLNKVESEHIIESTTNAFIVLGRDRPAGKETGYGGKAHTQCGSIDLVVGRMSPTPKEVNRAPGEETEKPVGVDPMFVPVVQRPGAAAPFMTDAARIYISQKTDIDENFNLRPGPLGSVPDSVARSGVAVKADAVRIIGNEGVKICTRTDGYNSLGVKLESIPGIDLCAGNRSEDLEPLVLGDKLRSCLSGIIEEIRDLNSIVQGIVVEIMHMNQAYGNHQHPPPVLYEWVYQDMPNLLDAMSANCSLAAKSMVSLQNQMINLQNLENDFIGTRGAEYICSRYNKTN